MTAPAHLVQVSCSTLRLYGPEPRLPKPGEPLNGASAGVAALIGTKLSEWHSACFNGKEQILECTSLGFMDALCFARRLT